MGASLTHLDRNGRARMVDVGGKPVTRREAVAYGEIRMSPAALRLLKPANNPKGGVFGAAILAGTLAAKRVDEWIPLCHGIPLDSVSIELKSGRDRVGARAQVRAEAKTGVEMEALTAVSVALLTVYDMCKSAGKAMTLGPIYLEQKSGGRSGTYRRGLGK